MPFYIYGHSHGTFTDVFLAHLRHVGYELRTVKSVQHPFHSSTIFDRTITILNVLLNVLPAFIMDAIYRARSSAADGGTDGQGANTLASLRRVKGYFDRLLGYARAHCRFDNDNVLTVYNRCG